MLIGKSSINLKCITSKHGKEETKKLNASSSYNCLTIFKFKSKSLEKEMICFGVF